MNIRILYKPDNMDGCFYQDAVNNLTTIYTKPWALYSDVQALLYSPGLGF